MVKLFRSEQSPTQTAPVGISDIAVYRPDWVLPNSWYDVNITRKFVKHTGIRSRTISNLDEAQLAIRAIKRLSAQTRCDLRQCAGLIFASPSFIPMGVANKLLDAKAAKREQLARTAIRVISELGLRPRKTVSTNSFCSGYAKAMTLVLEKVLPAIALAANEYILVVTSTRISRITDFGCQKTGPLFGDMATATMISRCDNVRHPVHFQLIDASFEKRSTNRPFFDFSLKQDVLTPSENGGQVHQPQRVVFSLDGMGIADVAPRAMAEAAEEIADRNGVSKGDVRFIVPHQAGAGIVRLAGMKLEAAGFSGELVNGLTEEVGNVSSSSVPFALTQIWNRLRGTILCPVAAVGAPGKNEVSQGCVLLKTTPRHEAAAA